MRTLSRRTMRYCAALLLLAPLTICCIIVAKEQSGRGRPTLAYAEEFRFTLPTVPSTIVDPVARADYAALHYWEGSELRSRGQLFSADDSLAIEQAVVDWLDILGYASDEGAGQAVGVLVDEIAGNEYVFDLFFDLVEKYAYGPDSPVFDEELFDKMLARVIASDAVDGADKIRPRYLRLQIAMNHPGTPAADFTYETPDGLCAQMSSIRAPYLLIYFYDPDCEECKMLAGDIERSPVLAPMIGGGQLCVLALYAGEDRTLWRRQLYDIPAQWINACDPRGEVADVLYALRAIPSLYLLGHDKTVILKDAAFGRVEDLLMGEVHKNRL